jgi:hypothetical protein
LNRDSSHGNPPTGGHELMPDTAGFVTDSDRGLGVDAAEILVGAAWRPTRPIPRSWRNLSLLRSSPLTGFAELSASRNCRSDTLEQWTS